VERADTGELRGERISSWMAILHQKKKGGAESAPPLEWTVWLELQSEEHAGVERRLNSARCTDGCARDIRGL